MHHVTTAYRPASSADLSKADLTGADVDGATFKDVKGLDTVKGMATTKGKCEGCR